VGVPHSCKDFKKLDDIEKVRMRNRHLKKLALLGIHVVQPRLSPLPQQIVASSNNLTSNKYLTLVDARIDLVYEITP
jgi:hypothetical protein